MSTLCQSSANCVDKVEGPTSSGIDANTASDLRAAIDNKDRRVAEDPLGFATGPIRSVESAEPKAGRADVERHWLDVIAGRRSVREKRAIGLRII